MKRQTEHAQCATAIRRDLKAAFPTVTFRVRSDSFSGGTSVHIDWIDGPTTNQVDRLISKYDQGHFDGSIDLYEYSNRRDDLPQAKYVQTSRDISRPAYAAAIAMINRDYGWSLEIHPEWIGVDPASDGPVNNGYGYQSHEIHRTLQPLSLLCGTCQGAILPGDAFCPACGTRTVQPAA